MSIMSDAEIIEALGGTGAVAELCEVTPQAVSNWKNRGFPARLHIKLLRECEGRGIEFDPEGSEAA